MHNLTELEHVVYQAPATLPFSLITLSGVWVSWVTHCKNVHVGLCFHELQCSH